MCEEPRVKEGAAERRSTHYLLLLAVGREALGQQDTVLQQHFGDGLGGQKRQLGLLEAGFNACLEV